MAKGTGLIGNFRGKVGNMVGYNLKDSNNKQTQGVRVYQPIVKNPKTYAQAEQRAKLAPINATYRALKAIIDRGQEGKAYGNKSRLAWLSTAMKEFYGGWFGKGETIAYPALVTITKGTLPFKPELNSDYTNVVLRVVGLTAEDTTLGAVSTKIIAKYPSLQNGDQLTFVGTFGTGGNFYSRFDSIILNTESTDTLPSWLTIPQASNLTAWASDNDANAVAVIASREAANGQHLRSTAGLQFTDNYDSELLEDAAKETAIKSYMAGSTSSDWAEESIQ